MSITEVRNQTGVRITVSELIAGLALIITAFSSLNGWVILPEKVRTLKEVNVAQDAKIAAIELGAQNKAEILARIDERTKRIEETLKGGSK